MSKDDLQKAIVAFEEGENIKVTGLLKATGRVKIIEDASFEGIS